MVFPALFTAGMVRVDATDSIQMVGACAWASVDPLETLVPCDHHRRVGDRGTADRRHPGNGPARRPAGLEGGIWTVIAGLNDDLTTFGLAVIGVFVLCWVVSAAVYRVKGYGGVLARG